jgi:hypothetical protein
MVNPSRKQDHVPFCAINSDPFILRVSHIKITRALYNQTNFFVFVDMLGEEGFQFLLIVGQFVLGNRNLGEPINIFGPY